MTRVEVAAMTLALHALRYASWRGWRNPCTRDTFAYLAVRQATTTLDIGKRDLAEEVIRAARTTDPRLLRARLALYLRTMLRAEMGTAPIRHARQLTTVLRAERSWSFYEISGAWEPYSMDASWWPSHESARWCPACLRELCWMPPHCAGCGEPWRQRRRTPPLYETAPHHDGREARDRRRRAHD